MRMRLGIELFKYLKEIADDNGVSQVDWAKAAGTHQPRISELVQLLEGREPADSRLFTLEKFITLHRGLTKLLGVSVVTESMAKKISQEEDRTKRILSKVAMLLEAADDQGEENLERQLDLLIALKK